MSRDWRLRVEDILAAAERATRFVGEMDLAAFKADERTSSAVLHQIFLIRNRAPDVPWEEIIGMRNIIAHGYFAVDLEVPWKTVRLDLPPLQEQVRRLLEEPAP